MGAHVKYGNSDIKLVDSYGNELAYFGGAVNRVNGTSLDQGFKMMPPGLASLRRTYFVDAQFGNNGNDGRSWESAFQTFEKAIDMARFSEPGYTSVAETTYNRAFVFMAPGHYDETTQLLWSGHQISVIGCGGGIPGKDKGVSFNYSGNTSATAGMLVNGSGNELCNFHMYCDAAIPALYVYYPGDNNYIHDLVIECDTNTTYGIYTTSMKGSWIQNCTIWGAFATAGIGIEYDASDQYAINGGVRGCHVYGSGSNVTGIYVDVNLVCYNFWIERNFVQLASGSSCKGIDIDHTTGGLIVDNYVSVPSSATAIEHAGGNQFIVGNHTAAGTSITDPHPAASG